ncbi:hypothetical protein G6F57_021217 [Rhizopus arrhizus]|nr:hypothetical protein G6F57_021217 [Rhizopus arrhizus]
MRGESADQSVKRVPPAAIGLQALGLEIAVGEVLVVDALGVVLQFRHAQFVVGLDHQVERLFGGGGAFEVGDDGLRAVGGGHFMAMVLTSHATRFSASTVYFLSV